MILINSSPKKALKAFQPFLPISVPMGVGWLLGMAEKESIKAGFIDEQVESNIPGLVAEYVKQARKPYIFGFSVLTVAFESALSLSRELKRAYPDSIIVFGGVHPSAMPEEVLSYKHIDAVIRGEADKILIDFYRDVKANKGFKHLDSVSYREAGRMIHNKRAPIVADLDDLPFFPYHLFASKEYDLGFVMSSRGCPYDCIFCSNRVTTGKEYRFRPAPVILKELVILFNRYGKRHVFFLDDNFLVNKERIYQLIEGIKKENLHKKMTFSFQARGDNVDRRLLEELHSAGFSSIFFGLETASDRLMKVIKKSEKVSQCVEAARLAKEAGFHVSATFLYGLPGETHQDRMDCVKLSNELKLDMVRYNNATPYPGTELYNIAREKRRLKVDGLYKNFVSVATFIENPFKKTPFAYVPPGSSEDEIRRDILFSYFNFYFNISRLRGVFAKPDDGMGWFSAGRNPLEIFRKLSGIIILLLALCVKFFQFFYLALVKKETAVSLKYFFSVFSGPRYFKQARKAA